MHCLLCHSSHCAFYTVWARPTKTYCQALVDRWCLFWFLKRKLGNCLSDANNKHHGIINQKSTTDLRCFQLWCAAVQKRVDPRHRLRWADGMLQTSDLRCFHIPEGHRKLKVLLPSTSCWNMIRILTALFANPSGQRRYVLVPLLWSVNQLVEKPEVSASHGNHGAKLQLARCMLHVFPLLFCLRSMGHCRCSVMELHNLPHVATCEAAAKRSS